MIDNNLMLDSNLTIVEFKSIARGIFTTDAMLKSASVSLLLATTLCPGKYLSIVSGDVDATAKALNTALEVGSDQVYSASQITAINKEVINAIGGVVKQQINDAIAVIESQNISNIVSAADISIDTAEVEIVELRLGKGCGANSFYIITGALTAVEEACQPAILFLKNQGALLAYKIIKSPDFSVLKWLEPAKCMC